MYQLRFYKFPGIGRGPIASGGEAIMKKPEYVPPSLDVISGVQ
jgi:hypothetical protein